MKKIRNLFRLSLVSSLSFATLAASAGDAVLPTWPEPTREMRPWVYNWWMASAVDAEGLEFQCRELAAKGFGGFHVIPIYGAKGYERQWRPLLSPAWVEAWNLAARTARRHGLGIDLTMGSGWCFGGPWVSTNDAASSLMRVKRAGPGGEGFMIDPFSPAAMSNHIARFAAAFGPGGTAERPRAFYHDSYEYFRARPKHGEDIDESQLACFRVWTDWCRANGYLTRNEAHGAPSNWLDFYALADIPETEMFGKTDRDILISKFASSAAHVKGTRLVSAESCTWIDEHFCETPGEIKRFLDRLFLAGINHVFYHGLCYSPVDAVWPGWSFYAALEMNPRNPIWREAGALNAYVTRCQSMFQTWESDNDLALVFDPSPYRRRHPDDPAPQMTIHDSGWFYGEKIGRLAKRLYADGYCFDYVSPRQLKTADLSRYAEVVDPEKDEVPRLARRERFGDAPGLLFTRWRKGGERLYFLVNDGTDDLCVTSAQGAFVAMNPLNGRVGRVETARLRPGHSLFVRGPAGSCRVARAEPATVREETRMDRPWQLTGICGGPTVPGETNLVRLVGWETFAPSFSGTMRYETAFDAAAREGLTLNLGEVREIAHAWLNGEDLGVCFMPPYEYALPKEALRPTGNRLVVEVTNLGANRLQWNDLNGVHWKYFCDANMLSPNYRPLDASRWPVRPSGLLGPVVLLRDRVQTRHDGRSY